MAYHRHALTRPFTAEDFSQRMTRAAAQAAAAGLSGLLVTPGPDLRYFAGYAPIAITERITMLAIQESRPPEMIVPALERPGAESAPGAAALALRDWADGDDAYEAAAAMLDPAGTYAISDSAWAMHLLGLQRALPGARYASLTDALPTCARSRTPRRSRGWRLPEPPRTPSSRRSLRHASPAGPRPRSRRSWPAAAAHGHCRRLHDRRLRPQRREPAPRGGRAWSPSGDMVVLDFGGPVDGYGSDTTRTVHVGEPTRGGAEVYDVVRRAQQAAFEAVRPGVPCQDIDRAAREVIAGAGYGEHFIHRTGHGIGLTAHEPPYLVEGERGRWCPACASRSSRGSTCRGGSACGSRTSSSRPTKVAGG